MRPADGRYVIATACISMLSASTTLLLAQSEHQLGVYSITSYLVRSVIIGLQPYKH